MSKNSNLDQIRDEIIANKRRIISSINDDYDSFLDDITSELLRDVNRLQNDITSDYDFMERNLEVILHEDLYLEFKNNLRTQFENEMANIIATMNVFQREIEKLVDPFDPSVDYEHELRRINARFNGMLEDSIEDKFRQGSFFEEARERFNRLYGYEDLVEEAVSTFDYRMRQYEDKYEEEFRRFKSNMIKKGQNFIEGIIRNASVSIEQEKNNSKVLDMDEEQLKTEIIDLINQVKNVTEKTDGVRKFVGKLKEVLLNGCTRSEKELDEILEIVDIEERKQRLATLHSELTDQYKRSVRYYNRVVQEERKERTEAIQKFVTMAQPFVSKTVQGFKYTAEDLLLSKKEIYDNRDRLEEYFEEYKERLVSSLETNERFQKYLEEKGLKEAKKEEQTVSINPENEVQEESVTNVGVEEEVVEKQSVEPVEVKPVEVEPIKEEQVEIEQVQVAGDFQAPAVVQPQITEVATVDNGFQAPAVVQPQITEVATVDNNFQAPAVRQPEVTEVAVVSQTQSDLTVQTPVQEESMISKIVNNPESLATPVQQPKFSDKTYQVMKVKQARTKDVNRKFVAGLIAGGALFVAGFTPAALLVGGLVTINKAEDMYQNVADIVRREVVEYKLDRLATKHNGELIVDHTTGEIRFDLPEDQLPLVQEKLDKMFRNSERGVSTPTTIREMQYAGFSRVTVDNLGAAFEEYGGVRIDQAPAQNVVEEVQTTEVAVINQTPTYTGEVIDTPALQDQSIEPSIYDMAQNVLDKSVANLTNSYKEQNTLFFSQTVVNMFNGLNDILYNNGIKYDDQRTAVCVTKLDEAVRGFSDNLMTQINEGFKTINQGTIAVLNQLNQLPYEEKMQKMEEFSRIYVERTTFDRTYIDCSQEFDVLLNDIASEYGITPNSKAYDELKSYIEFNKEAVKQQFITVTNEFSKNNSMTVGRVMMQVAYGDVYDQERAASRSM